MGELTDGLLYLAQLSRTKLNKIPADLSAEAADVFVRYSESEPVRVMQTKIDSGMRVVADVFLLCQVLENLIANAWKFTSKKLGAEISVGQKVGTNGQAVYSVKDNGVGFDMACADKLFLPFERLHAASEFPGTGIGLATVSRVIGHRGERLWAESAPGQGRLFSSRLPGKL